MLSLIGIGMLDAPPALHVVPEVRGYPLATGESVLNGSGYVSLVLYGTNDEYVPGTIYDQDPVAGTSLAPGSTVTVTVAIADSTLYETVPYLIGNTQTSAELAILQIYCLSSAVGSGGTVIAQSPAAFTQVPRGTTIQITMGGSVNSGDGLGRQGLPNFGTGVQ